MDLHQDAEPIAIAGVRMGNALWSQNGPARWPFARWHGAP